MFRIQARACPAVLSTDNSWLRLIRRLTTALIVQMTSTSRLDAPTHVWTASQHFRHAPPAKCSIQPHRFTFTKTRATRCVQSVRTPTQHYSAPCATSPVPLAQKDPQSVTLASSRLGSRTLLRLVHASNSAKAGFMPIKRPWVARSALATAKAALRLLTALHAKTTFTTSKANVWKVVRAIQLSSILSKYKSV